MFGRLGIHSCSAAGWAQDAERRQADHYFLADGAADQGDGVLTALDCCSKLCAACGGSRLVWPSRLAKPAGFGTHSSYPQLRALSGGKPS